MIRNFPKLSFLIITLVIVLDQLTKSWVSSSLHLYERIHVMPMFDITLAFNPGAAFSFLAHENGWQRWFFAGIAISAVAALFAWLYNTNKKDTWLVIALSLVLGGAVGNLIDRIYLSHVVDFILVYWNDHYFPAFNVADSAITVGAGMLILDVFRTKKLEAAA